MIFPLVPGIVKGIQYLLLGLSGRLNFAAR